MNLRDSIAAARLNGPSPEPDGALAFEFRFRPDDPVFAGHFPRRPLLPGVYQLEMTRAAAQWVLACSLAIRQVAKAKFLRPILPDETVRLRLKLTDANGGVQARAAFSVGGRPAGEALLHLWRSD
jgi:3-hydroxymyristoyl/3-hydroxydecanoyl-(acyl carrier protein) dehydratase